MKYSIVRGTPTEEEFVAIEHAMKMHKRQEMVPIIRKSLFGRPQLRRPLNQHFRFGNTK